MFATSQYWRTVALRNPALWTTIHFRMFPHLARARYYVVRSTKFPLNIIIDTCAEKDYRIGVSQVLEGCLEARKP